jgi:hypothetical protein
MIFNLQPPFLPTPLHLPPLPALIHHSNFLCLTATAMTLGRPVGTQAV